MRIAIIGAGITGLTAGYRLSQKGHQVTIFEKEDYVGGLVGGFRPSAESWSLENYFHHFFISDHVLQNLAAELGLSDKLFFRRPKSSVFFNGKISQLDSPLSVLKFPHLPLPDKLRTGLVTAYLKTTNDWKGFEKITAVEWLKKFYGQKAFEVLWQPLLKAKFGDEADKVSMVWFWARIKKRSTKLGYIRGGFQVLIDKLVEKIKEADGEIVLNHEVANHHNLVYGNQKFDRVILTTPIKSEKFTMIGALNLILILKEPFLTDGAYWLNINEPDFPFVAVVEHTNFVDKKHYSGNNILYIGGYYPQEHEYFKMSKEDIFAEFLLHLQKINPTFDQLQVTSYKLQVNLFAQPVIPINYSKIIPSFKTSNPSVLRANMQMVYPWDRGVNYAIELGEKVADESIRLFSGLQ